LCICDRVESLFKGTTDANFNLFLYQHFKEFGRPSNTGKLLQIGLKNNTQMKIFGNMGDEHDMISNLSSTASFILSPGENSVPISRFQDRYRQVNGNVTIVLVDSTWSQTAAMLKILPQSIPRVHIDQLSIKEPSQFLSRKQTSETKISTIEALALAIQALDPNSSVVPSLFEALRLSVDALNKQNGMVASYGNSIIPNVDVSTDSGAFQRPSVPRPTFCPHCMISGSFVNMGLRKPDESIGRKLIRIWKCKKCTSFFSVDEKDMF
jgi:DTW domain-containing protein YfiP